jgi:hypothetical protein
MPFIPNDTLKGAIFVATLDIRSNILMMLPEIICKDSIQYKKRYKLGWQKFHVAYYQRYDLQNNKLLITLSDSRGWELVM